jgi:hypothetical protein
MAATVNGGQPRRSSPLRRALVILGVVLAVCCVGAAAAGFGIYKWYGSEAGPAQSVADRYLSDLEAGNPTAAYALTCPDFKAHIDQATFVKVEGQTPQPRSHRVVGTSVATVNGQRSAIVTMDVTSASGDHTRQSIPLAVIGGTWYVCSVAPVP